MRIAYLATHYPSVSHTFIRGEIAALEQRGVEIVPIALNPPVAGDIRSPLDAREAARTWYLKAVRPAVIVTALLTTVARHPVPFAKGMGRALASGGLDLPGAGKAVLQFLEGVLVWRHCDRHGVSAIHAHFGQAPAAVAQAAARFGNDVGDTPWTWSVTIHGWHEFATEDTSRLRGKVADADLVVCISDFTRAQLLRLSAQEVWPRVSVVRCGIDFDEFPPRAPRPVGRPAVVVVTARLAAEKGHFVLLEAAARLGYQGLPVVLRVIGDGPLLGELRAAAVSMGVDVELVGALSSAEVAEALVDADVFCLPSFAEGLPISIMEAMATGVPVVTTYIGGIPELVVDGETGWVVAAGNADQLAAALRDALTSDSRDDIVSAARERVAELHDRDRNAMALESLLRKHHRISA